MITIAPTPLPVVLVVDDDHGIRVVLRRTAERAGYMVVEAETGLDGLTKLRTYVEAAALVFLDLRMPVMDGFAFRARQLESPELAMVPTVIVTGQGPSPEEFKRLAPAACLAKPASLDAIRDAIRRHARAVPSSAVVTQLAS